MLFLVRPTPTHITAEDLTHIWNAQIGQHGTVVQYVAMPFCFCARTETETDRQSVCVCVCVWNAHTRSLSLFSFLFSLFSLLSSLFSFLFSLFSLLFVLPYCVIRNVQGLLAKIAWFLPANLMCHLLECFKQAWRDALADTREREGLLEVRGIDRSSPL